MVSNNKGMAISTLGTLTLTILVLLTITAMIYMFTSRSQDLIPEEACKASVNLKALTTYDIKGFEINDGLTDLNCETKSLGELQGSRDDIKREIAKQASSCWYQFEQGKYDNIFGVPENSVGCHVCYTFSVPNEFDTDGLSYDSPLAESDWSSDLISSEEFYNFLWHNEYNPALIRGGSNINYVGDLLDGSDTMDWGVQATSDSITIKIKDIQFLNSNVRDFTGIISQDSVSSINKQREFLSEYAQLYVVVADSLSNLNTKSDAISLIESNLLSTPNRNDVLLLLFDVDSNSIRPVIGRDLNFFISEIDVNRILFNEFSSVTDEASFNSALVNSIEKITAFFPSSPNYSGVFASGTSPNSYYAYLSRGGVTFPILFDINSDALYSIAYLSATDENSWLQGLNQVNQDFFDDYNSGGFIYAILGGEEYMITDDIKTLFGASTTSRNNNIVIARTNRINSLCTQQVN